MTGRISRLRGFTLVELLMVLGIMAVLLLAAGPMWNGLTRSTGLKGATMQLRTTLALARQWAITHRENTYVVFPTSQDISIDGKGITSRVLRAYNVYTKTDGFVREWTFLPNGVIFDETKSDKIFPSDPEQNVLIQNATAYPKYPINYSGRTNWNMCALMFRPDGSSTGIGDWSRQPIIWMTEGFLDDAGTVLKKPNGLSNGLRVSSVAGQIKVVEK